MENLKQYTREKYDNLKEHYDEEMEYFKAMVASESRTDTFERNAINTLMVMLEMKSKMKELHLQEQMMIVYGLKNDKRR